MAFDFPNAPSIGQRVTGVGGIVYVWDGVKWASNAGGVTVQSMGDVGRNLLHNPLFNVTQRGVGPWTANGYTADRWLMFIANGTQSVSLFPLADADRASIGDEAARTCLSCTFTGSVTAGSGNQLIQRIEGVRRLSGKTVTVSFNATASASLKLGATFVQSFGTGGSPSASGSTAVQAITIVGSWGHYSMTFALPSASGKTLGTNGDDFTALTLMYSDATGGSPVGVQSGTIQLWGVQLEVGNVATPLEKPDPRYDLSNCLRFYRTFNAQINGYTTAGNNFGASSNVPTMRAASTISGQTYTGAVNASGPSIVMISNTAVMINCTATATGQIILPAAANLSADL